MTSSHSRPLLSPLLSSPLPSTFSHPLAAPSSPHVFVVTTTQHCLAPPGVLAQLDHVRFFQINSHWLFELFARTNSHPPSHHTAQTATS
jgi:hypothetical protein